ncbi:MAG: NAD(+) diphosphatase [Microbacteriaceae bacterium]
MRSRFADRLTLSRADVDRDHLTRAGGIEPLMADPSTRALILHDGRALRSDGGPLVLAAASALVGADPVVYLGRTLTASEDLPAGSAIIAGVDDDARAEELAAEHPGAVWADLRSEGHALDPRDAGLFTSALGILNWHAAYGFAPRSGRATEVLQSGWVRRDPETGTEFYPRTDAAIIVGVTDADDRLLLGSNAMWASNRFSVLAGFVEPGESLEAAVVREVFEESGLTVTDPVYLGSQPWPFPASLMLGFSARVADDRSAPTPDGEEILDLRWFTRDELSAAVTAGDIILPGPTSIARAIIEEWFGGEITDGTRW